MAATKRTRHNKLPIFLALAAGFLAFAAGAWLNRADMYNWQIGVSHDSIFYLDAAKNILLGNGVANSITGEVVPLSHYPPFYPLVISAVSFFTGADPLRAAYYLAIFLLGANTLLMGAVVYKYASCSITAGLSAAAFMLVSHVIIVTHYMAWSEPLFLFLVLTGILSLDKYLTSGSIKILLLAGLLFGLAIFTRYVGFILLPFAGAAILLFRKQPLVTHVKHIILAGLPAVLINGAWMLRNRLLTGTGTNRQIQYLGFGDARVNELKTTIKNWFFSDRSQNGGFNLTMILLLAAIITLIYLYRKDIKAGVWYTRSKLAELMLLFGLLYVAFLIVSVTFVDASTPLDDRMLVPFFIALLSVFLGVAWQAAGQFRLYGIPQVLLLLALAWFGYKRYNYTQYFHTETRAHGNGFTSKEARNADAAKAIANLPDNARLYAPGFDYAYLYYLTGRPVKPFSELENPNHLVPQDAFAAYLQPCCHEIQHPVLPPPYKAGEPVWGQHLYPILK